MANYIAFIIYLIILASLTFVASKHKNSDDFLVASKNVGWISLAISIFASIISSYNIVVSLSLSFIFGPWVALVYIGALFAFIAIYYLIKNESTTNIIKGSYNSIIDYLIERFGRVNASVLNISFMLVLFLFISIQFFINTTIFSTIMGWNKYVSTIIVGVIVLLYITRGGLKVEILTDVFQGVLMLSFACLLFFIDTSSLTIGTIKPIISDRTLFFSALALCVSQFLTLLVQPDLWQRFYATKSISNMKKSIAGSAVLMTVFIVPVIIIGLSARANGVESSDTLFFDLLKTVTPEWFLPIITVALFAAFMSSLDSALFALGTQLGKYGLWIKKDSDFSSIDKGKTVANIRISIFIITCLTLITSLFFTNFLTSVMQLMSLLTVNATVILLGIIMSLSNKEILISSIIGILLFFIAAFGHIINDEPYTVLFPSIGLVLYTIIQHFIIRLIHLR